MSIGYGPAAVATFHQHGGVDAGGAVERSLRPGEHAVVAGIAAMYGTREDLAELGRRLVAEYGSPQDAEPAELPADDPAAVEGTAGIVRGWLKEGDRLYSGGIVPHGNVGMRLLGDYELWATPETLGKLGDRMARRWNSPLVDAVSEMADCFDSISDPGMSSIPGAMTCVDADRTALVLALYGHFGTAVKLIASHAEDDGDCETHAEIRDGAELDAKFGVPTDEGKATALSEAFVRDLMGSHTA